MKEVEIYRHRFDDTQKRNRMWQILVSQFFQKFIGKNETVLDVPCGYGEFINNIKARKKYGVDLNPDSKKYLVKNIIFFKASSVKMKGIKNNSIDTVFVSNFFEHIIHDEIVKTLQEFKRVLKTNSQLIILQPNIRFLTRDYWMFFDHITPIDDRALTEIALSLGFKTKLQILKFLPFTTKSRLPQADIFIKIYLKLPILWHFFGKQSLLIFTKDK